MTDATLGRDWVFEYSADLDFSGVDVTIQAEVDIAIAAATWQVLGAVNTKGVNRENPVEDNTTQDNVSGETGSCYTGYSTVTANADGLANTTGQVGSFLYKDLATLAWSASPRGAFRMSDADLEMAGFWNITSFNETSDQGAQKAFTMGLQNDGFISHVEL